MIIPNQFSLVIIMPIYEDLEASKKLFNELRTSFNERIFIVAVDDGSTIQQIEAANINAAELDGVVIKLKRNVGHQRAIAIGLSYVADILTNFSNVVIMDSDGEDLPSSIPLMLSTLNFCE